MSLLKNEIESCKCPIFRNAVIRKDINVNKGTNTDILFIMAQPHIKERMSSFQYMLKRRGWDLKDYTVINGVGCIPQTGKVPRTSGLYVNCKYQNVKAIIDKIKPKVIITEGNALYTIVESTNIKYTYFYNYLLLPTSFYSPEFNCWVVPIPSLFDWVNTSRKDRSIHVMDNFAYQFTVRQMLTSSNRVKTGMRRSKYECVWNKDYKQLFEELVNNEIDNIAVDIETTGLRYYRDKIISVQISIDGITGYFVQWEDSDEFKTMLNTILGKAKCQIYANGLFDTKFLKYNGITNAKIDFDVNYAGHFVYSARSNSLKSMSFYFTDLGGYENKLDEYKRKYTISDYSLLPKDILSQYASMDAIVTYRLKDILLKHLNEKQKELYYNIYLPLANLFIEIEMKGMNIDQDYIKKYRDQCESGMKEIEDLINKDEKLVKRVIKAINRKAKHPISEINLNSENQLAFMFKALGAKEYNKTEKARRFSTEEACILRWKEDGIKYADEILKYKKLSKIVNTYLSEDAKILKNVGPDGRIHGSFNFQYNWVGRLSAKDPPIQTLPIKSNKLFRPVFKARDGYYLAECDFSGFHLRLVAMASGDESMVSMFKSKPRDMHSKTAAALFTKYTFQEYLDKLHNGTAEEKKKLKNYRDNCKPINFGLIYGLSVKALATEILMVPPPKGWGIDTVNSYLEGIGINNISDMFDFLEQKKKKVKEEELRIIKFLCCAKEVRERFFKEYEGVDTWIKKVRYEGKEKGYTDTFYGFRIWIPEYMYGNIEGQEKRIANLRNVSVNGSIIGTEANIMDRAMLQIAELFKKNDYDAYIVNQIHDSLLIEFRKDLLDKIKDPIKEIMTRDYPEYKGIPIDAEGQYGEIWGGSEEHPWEGWFDSEKD